MAGIAVSLQASHFVGRAESDAFAVSVAALLDNDTLELSGER
jgi:hypothetical protein